MKVKWLGHASFLLTSNTETKIITDPYATGGNLSYGQIEEAADIVTVSHEHGDHNNVAAVRGEPEVLRGAVSREIKGIKFKGVLAYHDAAGGKNRGGNILFCFNVDGIRVCHLGDLGHQLNTQQLNDLGKVDILLTPVGGFFTIDARVATELCQKLAPKVIIPMHYRNERCNYPVSGVEEFLQGKANVTKLEASEVEFKLGEFPAATQIIVLKPAL